MSNSNDTSEGMISGFTQKLKSSLNVSFYIISKGVSFAVWQAAVVLTIQFLQNLYFVFYPHAGFTSFDFEWNPEEAKSAVLFIVKATLIWPYLAENSTDIYFIFFYFCGAVLAFILTVFLVLFITKGKKKSFLHIALIHIIGFILLFLQTLFYLPILTMYILFFSCKEGYNVMLEDYECWTTMHYIHLSFGVLFLLLLLLLTIPTIAIYYENNCSSTNALRKISSTADVIVKLFQIMMTFSITLFNGVKKGNNLVNTYFSIILSALLWYTYYSFPRFFEPLISKLWILYVELFLLSAVCNLLGHFFGSYGLNGSLMLFFTLAVLLILFNFTSASGKEVILTKPVKKIRSFQEFEMYMKEFATILINNQIDREAELLIRGYIGEHSHLCPCPHECPLGIAIRSEPNLVNEIDRTQHIYKSIPVLVGHIERIYEYYIENNEEKEAGPMISFVHFLVNFSKEPTLAIKYLTNAKSSKQSIQQSFFIYKYEMILEDICKNRVALNDMGSINVLNVLKYEKYQKIFSELLEQSALMYNQYWSSLLDESPNMTKVCEVGFKVLNLENNIEKYWKKIQTICSNNPKDLVLYGNYLRQICNDNELAIQINEKAKEFAYSGKYAVIFTTNSHNISNFSTDGSACMFVSGDKRTLGQIMNCNFAFCKLFGYLKKDIIGANIKILMPELIAKHHDIFMLRNLERIKIAYCVLSSQELFTVGVHSNHYIFPFSARILSTPNLLNDMQYILKLRIDKKTITGTTCYLLLDTEGYVTNISSSCINLLHISTNTLSNYKIDMNIMAPTLFNKDAPSNCFHKNGSPLRVSYPPLDQLILEDNLFKEDIEVMPRGIETEEFHCYLSELNYELVGHVGYLVKLETKTENIGITSLHIMKNQLKCQFQYLETMNLFSREFVDDDGSYFDGGSHSVGVSSLDLDKSLRTNTFSGAKRNLSQLNVQNLKMLSQKTLVPRGSPYELVTNKTFDSNLNKNVSNAKTIIPKKPEDETPIKDNLSSNQLLRKQTNFITAFNENVSKDTPLKTMNTKYYDMLLPKYKQLMKHATGDHGISNLLEVIKGQRSYGDKIITQRLIDGMIEEVEEENYAQLLIKEIGAPEITISDGVRRIGKHKKEDFNILKSRLKTKKDLQKLIAETPYPLSMILLKPFTLIWIFLLSALLITEYVYTWYRLNGVLDSTEILHSSFKLKDSMMTLWYNSRELFLLSTDEYKIYRLSYESKEDYTIVLQNTMDTTSYNGLIYLYKLGAYGTNSVKIEDFTTIMYLYIPNTKTYIAKSYASNQAIGIQLESFVRIGKLELNECKDNEYLIHTVVDSLYSSLIDSIDSIVQSLFDNLKSSSAKSGIIDYVLLSLIAFDLVICLIVDIIFTKYIANYQVKIMDIFLDIPRKYTLFLNNQCETYLAELQNAEKRNDLDNPSEDDEKETGRQTVSLEYMQSGYQRIYTHKKAIGVSYLMSLIFMIIIAQAFSVWQFLMNHRFYNNLIKFSNIFLIFNKESIGYMETLNIYREYYANPFNTYGRNTPLNSVVDDYWKFLYERIKDSQKNDPRAISLLPPDAQNFINQINNGNLCKRLRDEYPDEDACKLVANGTVALGLTSVKAYLLNSLREFIYEGKTSTEKLINSQTLWDIKSIYDTIVIRFNEEIIIELMNNLDASYHKQKNNKVLYLVIFIIGFNFLFAVICYPLLLSIGTFVATSRRMLSLIPIDSIIMSRGFERLILKYLKK